MSWVYVEREQYIRACEELKLSYNIRIAIETWAKSVSLKNETPRLKRIYISPNNKYQLWSAGIPNPDICKGKSGGYRLIFFVNNLENTINLDYIDFRKNLGFKKECPRKKEKYNSYIRSLKEYLKINDLI